MLAKGRTVGEIARRCRSPKTVETHRARMMEKLGYRRSMRMPVKRTGSAGAAAAHAVCTSSPRSASDYSGGETQFIDSTNHAPGAPRPVATNIGCSQV